MSFFRMYVEAICGLLRASYKGPRGEMRGCLLVNLGFEGGADGETLV